MRQKEYNQTKKDCNASLCKNCRTRGPAYLPRGVSDRNWDSEKTLWTGVDKNSITSPVGIRRNWHSKRHWKKGMINTYGHGNPRK